MILKEGRVGTSGGVRGLQMVEVVLERSNNLVASGASPLVTAFPAPAAVSDSLRHGGSGHFLVLRGGDASTSPK